MEFPTDQYLGSENTNKNQNIFEIQSKFELPRLLDRLMVSKGVDLLGIRGTCSVVEPVMLEDTAVLTPEQITNHGHERLDRDTFLVTKYTKGGPVHQRTMSWAQMSVQEMEELLHSYKLMVPVCQTFIVYHPDYIYTKKQLKLSNQSKRTSLRDIPDEPLRTAMYIDDPAKAIVGIVVLKS